MKGGTLVVSRAVNNHAFYRKRFEALGFPNVTVTATEKDGLYSLIRTAKPDLLVMGARFYEGCTPFLMGELHRKFKKLEMAAVCIGPYPPELAMYFILNGVKSYVTSFDGLDVWYKGLAAVSKGNRFVSPEVEQCISKRRDFPMPAGKITQKLLEVVRLICNGFLDNEIADTLSISRNTVLNYKTEIFRSLNVRRPIELIHVALKLEYISINELIFYHKDYILSPLPDEKIKNRWRGNE